MGVPARHHEPARSGEVGGPPGNRPALPRDWSRGIPERYVAGADTRGRQEGRSHPWLQQVIHEISRLGPFQSSYSLESVFGGQQFSIMSLGLIVERSPNE